MFDPTPEVARRSFGSRGEPDAKLLCILSGRYTLIALAWQSYEPGPSLPEGVSGVVKRSVSELMTRSRRGECFTFCTSER